MRYLLLANIRNQKTYPAQYHDVKTSQESAKGLPKDLLPVVLWNYYGDHRNDVQRLSGLMFFDFDGQAMPKELNTWDHTYYCKTSASGNGFHLVVRIPEWVTKENWSQVHASIGEDINRTLGVDYDKNAKDIKRAMYLNWSEDTYYNPEADVYPIEPLPAHKTEIKPLGDGRPIAYRSPVEGNRNAYHNWYVFETAKNYGKDVRPFVQDQIREMHPASEWGAEIRTIDNAYKAGIVQFAPEAQPNVSPEPEPFDLEGVLAECWLDYDNIPEAPEPLFLFGAVPILTRGGIVLFKGQMKAGKSMALSYIIQALTLGDCGPIYNGPALKKTVAYFDTEQLPHHIAQKVQRHDHLDVFTLVKKPIKERLKIVLEYAKTHQPDVLIIDNIRDLVGDVNDAEKAEQLFFNLMNLNISIVLVQHTNKEGKNASGHLGSYGEQKAETIVNVYKNNYGQDSANRGHYFQMNSVSRNGDVPDLFFDYGHRPRLEREEVQTLDQKRKY